MVDHMVDWMVGGTVGLARVWVERARSDRLERGHPDVVYGHDVPPGHLPPPGHCRDWLPEDSAGHQPSPYPC
jgi:hypothetical protein